MKTALATQVVLGRELLNSSSNVLTPKELLCAAILEKLEGAHSRTGTYGLARVRLKENRHSLSLYFDNGTLYRKITINNKGAFQLDLINGKRANTVKPQPPPDELRRWVCGVLNNFRADRERPSGHREQQVAQ